MKGFDSEKWKKELALIPELPELKKRLDIFSQEAVNIPTDQIQTEYNKACRIFPFGGTIIEPQVANSFSIFRVRKNLGEFEYPNLISNFSYPPSALCTWAGRANLKYRPVFYGAMEPETALLECKPKLNDMLYLSVWGIDSDNSFIWSSLLPFDLPIENIWNQIAKKQKENVDRQSKLAGVEKNKELKYLYETTAKWFLLEDDGYTKSSWISNKYLYGMTNVAVLAYPSISTARKTTCLAINPNFVDCYMKIKKTYMFDIIKNKDQLAFRLQSVSNADTINMNLGKPLEEDYKFIESVLLKSEYQFQNE